MKRKRPTTADHQAIADRVSALFQREITPQRVYDIDILDDWQASHPVDAMILAELDRVMEGKR